jgi:hypothetical protein
MTTPETKVFEPALDVLRHLYEDAHIARRNDWEAKHDNSHWSQGECATTLDTIHQYYAEKKTQILLLKTEWAKLAATRKRLTNYLRVLEKEMDGIDERLRLAELEAQTFWGTHCNQYDQEDLRKFIAKLKSRKTSPETVQKCAFSMFRSHENFEVAPPPAKVP